MSLLSVPTLFHAEFGQHLLLGVVKGEVKDNPEAVSAHPEEQARDGKGKKS